MDVARAAIRERLVALLAVCVPAVVSAHNEDADVLRSRVRDPDLEWMEREYRAEYECRLEYRICRTPNPHEAAKNAAADAARETGRATGAVRPDVIRQVGAVREDLAAEARGRAERAECRLCTRSGTDRADTSCSTRRNSRTR